MQNLHTYLFAGSLAICTLFLFPSCSKTDGTDAPRNEDQAVNAENVQGVYQGMTPAASGPGIEMTVYLYPGSRAFRKMVYLKTPNEAWFDTGEWSLTGTDVTIAYDGGQGTDNFRIEGGRLYLLDADGNKLSTDIPNVFLFRLTE